MPKNKLFINVLTTIHRVKLAWLAKPIFSTSTLLMGKPADDAARPSQFLTQFQVLQNVLDLI